MTSIQFKIITFLLISMFLACSNVHTQSIELDDKIEVALRKIGHNILMNAKDSTSRVLPIEKIEDRYKISFESEIEFEPSQLVATINTVFKEDQLIDAYYVTVEHCNSNVIAYSFIMENVLTSNILHCGGRIEPTACYEVFIKFELPTEPRAIIPGISLVNNKNLPSVSNGMIFLVTIIQIIAIAALIGLALFLWRKKNSKPKEDHKIQVGIFDFDTLNMILSTKSMKINLTNKETELLKVLYEQKNETVERDTLLQQVWGDEGDYIGRTLDVFISKLRKHLEADSNIKIMNVRGVGYKFVIA